MPQVVQTDAFIKCQRELMKKGKKGKDAVTKSRAAMSEAATEGEIKSLSRTKHGESRLPNVEKYELGDGHRLVVQLVDTKENKRAFLFVGNHADAEHWLESHRNYRWVKRDSDSTLTFVQISTAETDLSVTPDVDFESPDSLLGMPVLVDIDVAALIKCGFTRALADYLLAVTREQWAQDPNGIVSYIAEQSNEDMALAALDLIDHAFRREWDALHKRVEVAQGDASIVQGPVAAEAMLSSANSEHFVTWEDSDSLPSATSWADWLLFLHPEQKEHVAKDFNGAARLRGVSGSGKTCVMVHRARWLARKYKEPILLVTLTESMRRLLDILVKDLCGAEAAYIKTSTMLGIAKDAIEAIAPDGLRSFLIANRDQSRDGVDRALRVMKRHDGFAKSALSKMPPTFVDDFLEEELEFVRQRFLPEEYDHYLAAKRHGRTLPLNDSARSIILAGVIELDNVLKSLRVQDNNGVVQVALNLVKGSAAATRNAFNYRCVLVDEVQDLSQLEIRILSLIPDATGKRVVDLPNGLFLVGDGAQTVYKRGFSLSACGIVIGPRSYVLQKNYRNTREILEAAYGLISTYEFADVDEENIVRPTEPHLSARRGERPLIVKCQSETDEADFVVNQIREITEEQRLKDEADELDECTQLPIGVIGFRASDRKRIEDALRKAQIPHVELREDVGWENNVVKITTLESAKGHEFHTVFIVGANQGAIPNSRLPKDDWKREAARFYVAMTRARDRLFLTFNVADWGGPSVFLASIQEACASAEHKRGKLISDKSHGSSVSKCNTRRIWPECLEPGSADRPPFAPPSRLCGSRPRLGAARGRPPS